MKTAISERAFQTQILQLARFTGWLTYHTHDSRRSSPGFPDLVLVRPPRVLFCELKIESGRLRPEQREWLEALRRCEGVEAYLWRPSDWKEIEAVLCRREARTDEEKLAEIHEQDVARQHEDEDLYWKGSRA